MKNKAAQIHTLERHMLALLFFSAVLLMTLYIFFVSSSIVNVVVREEIEQEIATIYSDVGELEFTYLALKDDITLELAYDLGFTDIVGKTFVTRKSLSGRGLTLQQ